MSDLNTAKLEELIKFFEDGEWKASEGTKAWQLFFYTKEGMHGMQIIKAPKTGTPYAEYWPELYQERYIMYCLNELPKKYKELEQKYNGLKEENAALDNRYNYLNHDE